MAIKSNTFMTILSIFLFLNVFTAVFSEDIKYNKDGPTVKEVDSTTSKNNQYALTFENSEDIPKYIKILLTPKEGKDVPTLCYSPSDPYCLENRRVLISRADREPAIAFGKKSEVKGNKLNVLVSCKNETTCGYTLTFIKQEESCELDSDKGIVYSFVVLEEKEELEFSAVGKSTSQTYIHVGIEGSENATIYADDATYIIPENIYSVNYEGAKFLVYKTNDTEGNITTIFKFSIKNAAKGEYIRLSVYSVHDLADENNGFRGPDNLLYPGGAAVLGAVVPIGRGYHELCLPVSALENEEFKSITDFYVTAKVYSKYGMFWLGTKDADFQDDTEVDIEDGLLAYLIHPYGTKRHICFEYYKPDESIEPKDVLFSVQLVHRAPQKAGDIYYTNPPMFVGQTYRYMVQKDKFAYYYGTEINKVNDTDRYSFNIFNRKGVTEMYMTSCDTFPNCTFETNFEEELPDGMELVRNTGKIAIYDRKVPKTMEALDQSKTIMLIKCVDDGNDNDGYCEFDASIFKKSQRITLIQDENFAKYVVQGEKGSFLLFFNMATKLYNVGVEIMIHSGEVLFEGSKNLNAEKTGLGDEEGVTKYLLSNKVFIDFNLESQMIGSLIVSYKALKNSFFTIKYISFDTRVKKAYENETIFSGESYLVSMKPTTEESLKLHLNNDRYKTKNPYLVNFFALNCDFKVMTTKNDRETEITFADGYAQDILKSQDGKDYENKYYNYTVNVEKVEQSNYNNKMCMLYVGAFQTSDKYFQTRMLIGNNVNQQIIFDDSFKLVKFLYPVPDTSKNLIVYANIIDKAYYHIDILIDYNNTYFIRKPLTSSTPYFLHTLDYQNKCPPDSFCNIVIEMQLIKEIEGFPKTYHMVEITVREATDAGDDFKALRVPTYIQKNIAKKDFTSADGYYYVYTDIGRGDQGDITINFARDYGEVFGRIVKKGTKDTDAEIEWMEMYRLPAYGWGDEANYDRYLKKYHISLEDTEDCIVGCYLILGIRISQIGEWALFWKFYQFSIITDIYQYSASSSSNKPIATIQVEEFIIGNVDISKNEKISNFYQVWLPRDAHSIHFDWQSELAGLYISIDEVNPSINNAHFTLLPNGTDSVLVISKQEIIAKAAEMKITLPYENSIEDVRLVIGVWTDKTDAADTELFSLRIHEVNLNYMDLDIYEVSTDQKVLCKPAYIEGGEYACLFMVMYDTQETLQQADLLIHASSTNKGDTAQIYANHIYSNIYTQFNVDSLRGNIPSYTNSKYNSVINDANYFYIKLNYQLSDQYLFVNVITQTPDDIMLLASMNCYDISENNTIITFYPNPRTEQIIQMLNDTLRLDFFTNSSLIVNIENLGGEADVRWEEDADNVYYLRGKGDRLTLTTSKNYRYLHFKRLKSDKAQNDRDPGFVFVMNFYKRNSDKNFDEVVYGNSIELGYRDTDLPLYLYSKAIDYHNDIHLSVTFRDSRVDTEGEYKKSPIDVRAFFDKRTTIYAAKLNPDFEPGEKNRFEGIYDPAIKTAQVFMSQIDLEYKIHLKPEDYPTLLLYVGKNQDYEDKIYKDFNAESQFSTSNNLVIPNEKVYNYAKYFGMIPQYYKLRTDKTRKIMKIVLSFNSDRLSWTISTQQSSHENTTEFQVKKGKGKILLTLTPKNISFIYINIFNPNWQDEPDYRIFNYAFKYINVEKDEDFFDYEILDQKSSLEYKEETKDGKVTITCTFNAINTANNKANVTYFLKIADANDYIKDENFTTVALTETPYYTIYKRNPTVENKKITLSATGDFANWCYINVIAQIQQNKALEYVAYDGIYVPRNIEKPSEKEEKSSNTALIVGVSVSLSILIIGLAVAVFFIQKKNKSLATQIKHVSFQQGGAPTDTTTDPDLLLAKS